MSYIQKFKKLYLAFFIILLICFTGVIGFKIIEGYSLGDALYMTIITVSTVGFREVSPLSDSGKYFTIFLIVMSIGTFAYAIGVISFYLIDGEFRKHLLELRKVKKIQNLSRHTIVCGFGRNGKQIVQELEEANIPYVLIEKKPEVINDAIARDCKNYIEGEATDDEILIEAGIMRAEALITTLPDDADNVFVVLTARGMNKNLLIISRASKDTSDKKLKMAGANNVVMPDKVGGTHMASLVIKPDVVEFLNILSGQDDNISLEEISYDSLPMEFKNRTIKELHVRKRSGANIVGLKNKEGQYILNPTPDELICEGTKVFVLGMKEQIEKLLKWD
ncbi:MAG: NAD-binding protein [Flavobacteriales bacterium]|nr:NAD-binding protein [Flavobacteriales bacterium]